MFEYFRYVCAMTTTEKKQLKYLPCEKLDEAIMDRFGVKSETSYSLLHSQHVTLLDETFKDVAVLQRIHDFIAGFNFGHDELSNRLADKNLWL